MSVSPTARSLKLLRSCGYVAGTVERRVPYNPAITQDLFGCVDIFACHPSAGVLLVQATSLPNIAARVKKARTKAELAVCLRAGVRFEVWGWYKQGNRWKPKRVEVPVDGQSNIVLEAKKRKRKEEPDLFGTKA